MALAQATNPVSRKQRNYLLSLMDERLEGALMELGAERLGLEVPANAAEASNVIDQLLH
jgi:hypothetical protein